MGMHPTDKTKPLKLTASSTLNEAIKLIGEHDPGAASVIAVINLQRPDDILDDLNALDKMRVYGHNLYHLYWDECHGNMVKFVAKIYA